MDDFIKFENVSYSYDDADEESENKIGHINYAVKNASFKIEKGEFAFLVGASGSGKSEIEKILSSKYGYKKICTNDSRMR